MNEGTIIAAIAGGALGLIIGETFRRYELADRFWVWLLDRQPSDRQVERMLRDLARDEARAVGRAATRQETP